MDLSLPLQILGVLLSIFVIVMLVLGRTTWRWFHIVTGLFVFAAAMTFVAYAALSLKTRSVWEGIAQRYDRDLGKATKDADTLREGNPENPDDTPLANVRGLNEELSKLYVQRGRVWRGCLLTEVNAAQARLKFSTQPPAVPGIEAPAEPQPNRIEPKAVLYLFKDQVVDNVLKPGEQRAVPAIWVGEVEVTDVSDTDVTVTPTMPLDRQQASHLLSDNVTWTIYEMMPLDSHEALTGLTEEQLLAIMPNNLQLPAPAYQELIARFARDGQQPLESDPAERRWAKVKFLSKQTVTVDSPTTQIERDSKYFDEQGQALLTVLRAGKPVEFEKGAEAILHQQKADELISAGVCEKVADVYRRPLQDFASHFHEIFQRLAYLEDRSKEVGRQTAVLLEAKEKAAKQLEYRTKEKAQLEQDLAKFKSEQERVTAYRQRLEAAVADVTQRVTDAENSSLELAEQLASLQQQMAREIDRRTLSATTP